MKLFMIVTKDEYELPVAVSDSIRELAKMQHLSYRSLVSCFCKGRHPGRAEFKYYKRFVTVEVDDEC